MFSDKEVDKKIKYKLGIFDDREPSKEDLNRITDIFISNVNARGEVMNVDLSDLVKLRKLKSLDLKGFDINAEILGIINSFPELMSLVLYSCQSEEPLDIRIEKLKNMILDNCGTMNLSGINLPERLTIISGGTIDVSQFVNNYTLRELEIKNSEVLNSRFLEEIKKLKRLNLDGSTLDYEDVIKTLEGKKIKVSHELEYNPIR